MFYLPVRFRNQRFLSVFTDTNTNLTIILTQDIVGVNRTFSIFVLDHSKIYDIYSSKTPFVFYKMSQRFFLYRTTITKQINTAKFPNIENISSHNG